MSQTGICFGFVGKTYLGIDSGFVGKILTGIGFVGSCFGYFVGNP